MNLPPETIQHLRKLLHLDQLPIIEDASLRLRITKQFLPTTTKNDGMPTLTAIGGGPGAGKSYFYDLLKKKGKLPSQAVLHDPDLVMLSLPDYLADARADPAMAFKRWEKPALQLANEILLQALLNRNNIIYLRSFALADSLDFVRQSRKLGYHVTTHLMTCHPSTAIARITAREKQTSRHTPEQTVLSRHSAVKKLLPQIKELSDCWYLYENDIDGREPTLTETTILES